MGGRKWEKWGQENKAWTGLDIQRKISKKDKTDRTGDRRRNIMWLERLSRQEKTNIWAWELLLSLENMVISGQTRHLSFGSDETKNGGKWTVGGWKVVNHFRQTNRHRPGSKKRIEQTWTGIQATDELKPDIRRDEQIITLVWADIIHHVASSEQTKTDLGISNGSLSNNNLCMRGYRHYGHNLFSISFCIFRFSSYPLSVFRARAPPRFLRHFYFRARIFLRARHQHDIHFCSFSFSHLSPPPRALRALTRTLVLTFSCRILHFGVALVVVIRSFFRRVLVHFAILTRGDSGTINDIVFTSPSAPFTHTHIHFYVRIFFTLTRTEGVGICTHIKLFHFYFYLCFC